MKAGLLKEKILICEPTIITSEYGENKTDWNIKYSTKANVKFQSQNRTNENNEIFYNTTVTFQVRYYVPITEWDRIKWANKYYRILSLLPNKDNQSITIISEVVNE